MRQAGSTEPQSDFGPATMSMLDTDQVSPAETGNIQPIIDPPSRDGPTEKRPETSTVQTEATNATGHKWDDTFAAAALKRAIQSSPARLLGSQQSPIEVGDDLTPKPTRRLLFPSPRREGEMKTLDGNDTSPTDRPSKSTSIDSNPLVTIDDMQSDKENCPPPLEADDELNNIFQDINFPLPKTPEKKSRSPHSSSNNSFKTPTPASRRNRHHLSPTALRALRSTPSSTNSKLQQTLLSPSQSAAHHQELTPFTAQLNALLASSDPVASPGRRNSPWGSCYARGSNVFDFEPLSELGFDTTGFAGAGGFDAAFWSTDPLAPGEMGMVNEFGVYEDPEVGQEGGAAGEAVEWDVDSLFGKSPAKKDGGGVGDIGEGDRIGGQSEQEMNAGATVEV